MDARRGKAYTGLYAFGTDGWRALAEDGIRPVAEWLDELADRLTAGGAAANGGQPDGGIASSGRSAGDADASVDGRRTGECQAGDQPQGGSTAGAARVLFAGDYAGFRELLDGFAARIPAEVALVDDPLTASAVAALAWMHGERCRVDDPHNLIPNYTQLSEPEKKLAAKHAALKP
jgi:tRNA threonylcarbamoyladenosine biosynthesis protein TsaB